MCNMLNNTVNCKKCVTSIIQFSAGTSMMASQFNNEDSFRDLFVSPSNSAPSEEIAPYMELLFPNVPERAKQNNVLLKCEELYLIEDLFTSSMYCPEYDVTVVIDQGACIEDQVRGKLEEIGRKARVNCAFLCCILTSVNSFHEHAACGLYRLILNKLDWNHIVREWGSTTTNLTSGPVSDYHDPFALFTPNDHERKEADSSFIELYSESLCKALGMDPVPSLVIESTNSDDFWKSFQGCIAWLAGSYLRVNTVISVKNSPEDYSGSILNFDSTVDNLLYLADRSTDPVTKEALLLSAKIKASVTVLQLRLLQCLMDPNDVDAVNELLAEDIALAQSLCPDLGIRLLERVPVIEQMEIREFSANIRNEILHYQNILNRQDIRSLHSQLRPRDAIASATCAIVHYTDSQIFGPICEEYSVARDSAIQVPRRAICTLNGDGNIIITPNELGAYFRQFSPEPPMMDADLRHNPINIIGFNTTYWSQFSHG